MHVRLCSYLCIYVCSCPLYNVVTILIIHTYFLLYTVHEWHGSTPIYVHTCSYSSCALSVVCVYVLSLFCCACSSDSCYQSSNIRTYVCRFLRGRLLLTRFIVNTILVYLQLNRAGRIAKKRHSCLQLSCRKQN